MANNKELLKIGWSIDPFEKSLYGSSARLAKTLSKSTNSIFEPIYVLSPVNFGWFVKFPSPHLKKFEKSAIQSIQKLLRTNSKGIKIAKPKVLVETSPHLRSMAKKLNSYARQQKFDALLISSHGRKGLDRITHGSFLETLLNNCPIPLFVTSSVTEIPTKFQHLFFATDFTPASRKAFIKAVDLAKRLNLKMILFHKAHIPVDFAHANSHLLTEPIWDDINDYYEREKKRRQEEANSWLNYIDRHEIDATVIFDEKIGSISNSIIKHSKKFKNAIIAMASQSGPIESTFLGNVTRKVVRSSPYPLWLVHPKK